MNNSLQQIESVFYQGMLVGAKIGFDKGYIQGVEDFISFIGTEASTKLREEHNGNPMAFYRQIKSKYEN